VNGLKGRIVKEVRLSRTGDDTSGLMSMALKIESALGDGLDKVDERQQQRGFLTRTDWQAEKARRYQSSECYKCSTTGH
jgi:hypothetical protein